MFDFSLFFRLFNPGVPFVILVIVLLLSAVLSFIIACHCKQKRCKGVLIVWIAACVFLMLYISVFKREPKTEMSINLVPFWSIGAMRDGLVETFYEKIFNVLFFVPYGCLLGAYFRHKTIKRALLLGLTTSVVIELLQLFTRTGTCETDDVICNTFGCFIGAGMFIACKRICKIHYKAMK